MVIQIFLRKNMESQKLKLSFCTIASERNKFINKIHILSWLTALLMPKKSTIIYEIILVNATYIFGRKNLELVS